MAPDAIMALYFGWILETIFNLRFLHRVQGINQSLRLIFRVKIDTIEPYPALVVDLNVPPVPPTVKLSPPQVFVADRNRSIHGLLDEEDLAVLPKRPDIEAISPEGDAMGDGVVDRRLGQDETFYRFLGIGSNFGLVDNRLGSAGRKTQGQNKKNQSLCHWITPAGGIKP